MTPEITRGINKMTLAEGARPGAEIGNLHNR
jgi:hypothetical protein